MLLLVLKLQTHVISSAKAKFKITHTTVERKVCVSVYMIDPSPLQSKMEASLVQGSLHSSELQEL